MSEDAIDVFGRVLRGKLRDQMNELADSVATGQCRTFEEYKMLCGTIQGLARAERELLDLLNLKEKSDAGDD